MSNDYKKLGAIIKHIYAETEKKNMNWQLGGNSKYVSAEIGGGKTIILSTFTRDEEPFEVFEINNTYTGGTVTFNDSSFPRKYPAFGGFETWYLAMGALREKAIRQAEGIDGILEEIIDELGINDDNLEVEDSDLPF